MIGRFNHSILLPLATCSAFSVVKASVSQGGEIGTTASDAKENSPRRARRTRRMGFKRFVLLLRGETDLCLLKMLKD